ncbi:thioesterase family protein [Limibacter armeniacum]|uniref:acyl-CoA thioesterase n=1 Tax=Limibacter armeniacum TaxID=466084 RepID=UPI002FE5AEEA
MYSHEVKERIRYADTDQMGFVYYGNYARFYEIGRVEALRALGVKYKQMEEEGIMLPVLECYSKYIKPAKYDDLITIKTMIKELPSARIFFEYEILSEDGQLLNQGKTTLVFMRSDSHRPCKAPEEILKLLEPYFADNYEKEIS